MSPRTSEQFQALRDASRRKILDVSLQLFGTIGYEATSIAAIARKAGISKGLLYNYFDSKEDLLKGLISDLSEGEEGMVEAILDPDPHVTIRNILTWFFNEMRTNREKYRLITRLALQVDQFDFIREIVLSKMKGYLEMMEQLFEELGYPDPKGEAMILGTILDGIGVQSYMLKEEYPMDDMEQHLIKKYCP